MRKNAFYLIVIIALQYGCSDEEVNQKKEPAYFTLAHLKGSNSGGRASSASETSSEFNLGDIKASKEFYFLLGNGGDNPIYNVKLESSNPMFDISPRSISILEGKNSIDNSVIPLISLGVLHGMQLNGVGYTELLPMGENEVTLSISGKVVENGDSVEVNSTFDVTVSARQMDIKLYSNDVEIDFSSSNAVGQWIGTEFASGLPSIPAYDADPSNIKIKNTGNVEIKLSLISMTPGPDTVRMVLQPNQLESINYPPRDNTPLYFALLIMDGNGTITDRSRVRLGTNGKGYVIIQHED